MNAAVTTESRPRLSARMTSLWIGVAIVLVAANLRPAVVGVAPVLSEISAAEGLSSTAAGVLSALPVFCFGLFAPAAPWLARRFGIERTVLGALVLLCAGFAVRSVGPVALLFVGNVMAGAAIATGNVLLPALIKRDFSHRTGVMTGLYTMAVSAGGALAAGITVPVAQAAGLSWRGALAVWGLFTLVALVIWLPQTRRVHRIGSTGGVGGLWRDGLAWQVTGFMGLQSLGYYAVSAWIPAVFVGRGFGAEAAGWLLSLASFVGIIGSMVAPMLAARYRRQRAVALVITGVSALGLIGVILLPGGEIPSMALLGLGQGAALGLALTLVGLRSPDAPHTSQLSGMAQSIGYMLAAVGPFLVGVVHDATGSWTIPLLLLLVLFVPQAVVGVLAGRDLLVGRKPASQQA
ncbi:CynX/NimT family MFS transporter [Pseudonocardia sp. CA-142604]|uniref:CynX/NimT family MFS transporter n=1 Tax=Pseudonocardia sp. CA-142604 TaxID=3240024 RepID=UPI003D93922E